MKKTILNKMQAINAAEKTELATIYDDISGAMKQANSGAIQVIDQVPKMIGKLKDSLRDNKALIKELDKAEGVVKSIGLDSELKKISKARTQVEKNINSIEDMLNSLYSF